MAKFQPDQAADVLAVQQAVNDWARELDLNNGTGMGPFVTEACEYHVRGVARHGRDAVVQFYNDRIREFDGSPTGVPVQRHMLSNFRVTLPAKDHAKVDFLLVYFMATGEAPIKTLALPTLVADVQMECRRDGDGEWRVAFFNSCQIFVRGG